MLRRESLMAPQKEAREYHRTATLAASFKNAPVGQSATA